MVNFQGKSSSVKRKSPQENTKKEGKFSEVIESREENMVFLSVFSGKNMSRPSSV